MKGDRELKTKSLVSLCLCAMMSFASTADFAFAANPMPIPEEKPNDNAPTTVTEPITNILDVEPTKSDTEPTLSDTLLPYAPPVTSSTGTPDELNKGALYLVAKLTKNGEALTSGVVWRIFDEKLRQDGHLDLVAQSDGGDAEFRLDPGTYLLNTSYGYASATNRLVVKRGVQSKTVVLNAGGVRLSAALSGDMPIKNGLVSFSIFGMDFNSRGERHLIAKDVKPGTIVPLNAATYHVISVYGTGNSQVRADLKVDPGKLTSATVYHNAADITLKLVNEAGGEALANTSWSVVTPGGDIVTEANGAFPDVVLATGEYDVIARNDGVSYTRTFEVKNGEDREVEVLTSQIASTD